MSNPHVKLNAQLQKIKKALEEKKYQLALNDISDISNRVSKNYPYWRLIYFYKGIAFQGVGEKQQAEKNYKQATAIDKEFVEAYFNLAILYLQNKKIHSF